MADRNGLVKATGVRNDDPAWVSALWSSPITAAADGWARSFDPV